MTLTELPDLLQGSDAWMDQRRGLVTASVVGKLLTGTTVRPASNDISRALTAQLVAERITGYTDPTYVSDDMLRGQEAYKYGWGATDRPNRRRSWRRTGA